MTETCPLCNLERRTPWHYESGWFVVLDCETCGGPMWVQRAHGPANAGIRRGAHVTCRALFGAQITFTGPGRWPDHYHEHVHGAADLGALDHEAA